MRGVDEDEAQGFARIPPVIGKYQQPAQRVSDHHGRRLFRGGGEECVQLVSDALGVSRTLPRLAPDEPRSVVGAEPGHLREFVEHVVPAARSPVVQPRLQNDRWRTASGAVDVGAPTTDLNDWAQWREIPCRPMLGNLPYYHARRQRQEDQAHDEDSRAVEESPEREAPR